MTELQAIILGGLQGAGEFLPISSSAHLALAPRLFGWEYQGLAYDVMLHLGTLFAVLIYFAKDWLKIFRDAFASPRPAGGGLLWLLVLASVPAAIAGLALNDYAETVFRDPRWIAFNLVFFSGVIWLADRRPAQRQDETAFGWKDALTVGLAQCIALMPGLVIDGNDVIAVYEAVGEAVKRARVGEGPTLIECKTYRWRGHFEGEVDNYRAPEEVKAWLKREPLAPYRKLLLDQGVLNEEKAKAMEHRVIAELEEAVEFARQSPLPQPETALEGLWA